MEVISLAFAKSISTEYINKVGRTRKAKIFVSSSKGNYWKIKPCEKPSHKSQIIDYFSFYSQPKWLFWDLYLGKISSFLTNILTYLEPDFISQPSTISTLPIAGLHHVLHFFWVVVWAYLQPFSCFLPLFYYPVFSGRIGIRTHDLPHYIHHNHNAIDRSAITSSQSSTYYIVRCLCTYNRKHAQAQINGAC